MYIQNLTCPLVHPQSPYKTTEMGTNIPNPDDRPEIRRKFPWVLSDILKIHRNPYGSGWWVSTPIEKSLAKMGIFPQMGVKIKHIWKHHLVYNTHQSIRCYLLPPFWCTCLLCWECGGLCSFLFFPCWWGECFLWNELSGGETTIRGILTAKQIRILPRNLTWNLKMMVWKMVFLFQGCILRFHVNLPGCNTSFHFWGLDFFTGSPHWQLLHQQKKKGVMKKRKFWVTKQFPLQEFLVGGWPNWKNLQSNGISPKQVHIKYAQASGFYTPSNPWKTNTQ